MGMYCKNCHYDLSRCVSQACPECGDGFDPADDRTYDNRPGVKPWYQRWPSRVAAFTLICLTAAWFLGVQNYLFPPSGGGSMYASAYSQLLTIRSQTELYANQHNGQYPTLAEMQAWDIFTLKTDIDGNTGNGTDHIYGPYLQQPPVNPMTKSHSVALPGKVTRKDGWEYDPSTRIVRVVMPTTADFNRSGLSTHDAVVP